MKPMPIAGRHTLILPFGTSLGRWTDPAARTGKRGLPAGSACEPSVPEFPLTLVHTRTGPRTHSLLFTSLLPITLVHTRTGPRTANSLLRRSCADGSKSGLAALSCL